jgi:hypothetical protein
MRGNVTFQDLGDVTIRVGLDIANKFDRAAAPIGSAEKPAPPFCNFPFAKINCRAGRKPGELIFMKPVDPRSVSMDVRAQFRLDISHEPTRDQVFGESQFESHGRPARCEAAAPAPGATTRATSAGRGRIGSRRDKQWRAM